MIKVAAFSVISELNLGINNLVLNVPVIIVLKAIFVYLCEYARTKCDLKWTKF